jgi:hypothetical protein
MLEGNTVEHVSGEYIRNVIESDGFVKRLVKAGDITLKTRYETSFDVAKRLGEETPHFSHILIGSEYCASNVERIRAQAREEFQKTFGRPYDMNTATPRDGLNMTKIRQDISERNKYRFDDDAPEEYQYDLDTFDLILLHFHPELDVQPSGNSGDLSVPNHLIEDYRERFGLDLRAIEVICRNDIEKDIDILCFQQIPEEITDWSFLDGLYADISNRLTNFAALDYYLGIRERAQQNDDFFRYLFSSPDGPYVIAEEMKKTGLYNAENASLSRDGKWLTDTSRLMNLSFDVKRVEPTTN